MKIDRPTALTLLITFLIVFATLPIANYNSSNRESLTSNILEKSSLNADYAIYENETEFYAINNQQEIELKGENFSSLMNQIFSSASEGSLITITPGEYLVSATLKILKPLHIYAYGATFKVNSSTTPVAVQIGGEENPIFNPHSLKGAKIINLGEKSKGIGVLLYAAHFGVLEDLEIWFFDTAIHSMGSWDYTVRNCVLRVNRLGVKLDQDSEGINRSNQFKVSGGYIGCETGVHIAGNCQNVIIDSVNICDSSEQGVGVWIENAEHTIIKGCYFENNPNMDIKIGSGNLCAKATQIEECYFLVKKTAIKIENSHYVKVEGCMAINDNGNNTAVFIEMTEKAIKLIYEDNFIQNLENNLFFGLEGTNVEID